MGNWNKKNCGYDPNKLIANTFAGKWINEHVFSCPDDMKFRLPKAYRSTADYNRLIQSMTIKRWSNLIREMKIQEKETGFLLRHKTATFALFCVARDVGCAKYALHKQMVDLYDSLLSEDGDKLALPPPIEEETVDESWGIDIPEAQLLDWLDYLMYVNHVESIWGDNFYEQRHNFHHDKEYLRHNYLKLSN